MIPCNHGIIHFNEWENKRINRDILHLNDSRSNRTANEMKWQCIGEFCSIFPCNDLTGEMIAMAPHRDLQPDTRIRTANTPIEAFGGN